MRLHLNGPQLGRIRKAIVEVYGPAGSGALALLDQALTDTIENKSVFDYVTVQEPFPLQVRALLSRANGEGWLPSLLGAVQRDQPEAAGLQELLRSFMATASAREVLEVAAGTGALAPQVRAELEQMLPGGVLFHFAILQQRVRSVCRIDYADFSPPGLGTGFLVGADLVLTNWHNVRRVIDAPEAATQLRFRFDLLDGIAAATNAGRVARAKADGRPVVRWSPAAGVEIAGGTGEPSMETLDYALVRLDERVTDDTLLGSGQRGHVGLKKTIPMAPANSALVVMQHPLRGELQFAIGKALGPNETGSRLKHTASTQYGSSGAPLFDAGLLPIALHNGARTGSVRATQDFNTAVPLTHIVADLARKGETEMLED